MPEKKETIYELTQFYCEVCKEWHSKPDKKFFECMNRYGTYYSFKAEKREVQNG